MSHVPIDAIVRGNGKAILPEPIVLETHRNTRNAIHNDDIIHTPDVVVFKTDTAYPKLMEEFDWYHVNVITCAAVREMRGIIIFSRKK